MKLRTISRSIVASLVVLVGLVILVHNSLASGQGNAQLMGTSLGAAAAPDFTLTDQTGAHISLRSLRGHPVVLTFLYTHSQQTSPQIAQKLRTTAQSLGGQAKTVDWVAVSVDPTGDTPASATAFARKYSLQGYLRYLLGSPQQLQAVWQAYHVAVQPTSSGQIDSTTVVYLIDSSGHEQVLLDGGFTPAQLTGDLRILLASH